MSKNWWDAAPLANQQGGNWWDEADLVDEAAPAPPPRFQPTDENGIPRRDVAFDTVQTDPLGLRSLRAAAGLGDATGGLYGGPKKLPATGDIFNKPMISSPDDIRNADLSQLDSPRALATDKMSRAQSVGMGVVDYGRQSGAMGDLLLDYNPGAAAGTKSAMDAYRAANQGIGPIEQGFKNIVDAPSRGLNRIADGQGLPPVNQQIASIGDPNANSSLDRDFEQAMTTSLQENPFSTRIGQIAALTAGGGAKATEGAIRTLPRMTAAGVQKVLPQAAAKYVASNLGSAKALRYGGRLTALGGVSGADYAATNFMSEATNQARLADGPRATTDDRVNYTTSELDNPLGYAGAIVSPLYRAGRFGVTTAVNTARATGAANKAAPPPEIMAAGLGKLPSIKYQGGSFTPADVQARVAFANTVDPKTGKSLRERVIDDFLDQGFDVDQAETAVRIAAYNGVSEVPEALFEISPALQEMAVAAGRLHGKPAQKMLQQMFTDRKEEFPNALREALRKATGASGDDFEEFVASMKAEGRKAAEPGYQKAHAATISDQTWQNIVTMLRQTPDGVDAAKRGAQLARNSARMRPEYVQAAEELEALRRAIAAGQVPNGKLSTLALDFLDRGINRKIKLAMTKGDADYAGSLLEFRNAFRGSGLDADTGLNVPRTLYAQYKAVAKAAEFGEKAAGKTTPLRLMKSQFVAAMRQADEAFEEGIGEGSSIIDTALLQGWIRGAENFIETADNAQTAIRQLYGSERQREKLLAMMRELPEDASSGLKADNTKRIKALVGSKPGVAGDRYEYDFALSTGERAEGSVELPSLFSRQKNMLESERLVTGGSPTSGASEALDNQLRQRNSLETLFTMAETAINSPAKTAARIIDNMRAPPLLRDPEASAIIGELLTTRGKDRLLAVIAEIRARKLARDGGSNTAPPTGPRPPPPGSASPQGPIRAAGFGGFGGKKPPPGPRTQDTISREIKDIEKKLRRKGYTLNEAETLAEKGTLPPQLRGLMIQHGDLIRESGRMQGAARTAKGGVETDPEYLRAESEMNKAMDDVANAEYEIARELRERGLNWEGDDAEFMGVVDQLRREGKLSNYLASRVEDLRAASTRMFDAEAKMRARVQAFAPAESYPVSAPASDVTPGFRRLDPDEKARFRPQGLPLRGDLGNALAGAGLGAAGPADSNEERLRNMAVGAGIGFGARRFGKAFGAEADDVATAGAGGTPKPKLPDYGYDELNIGRASVEVTRVGDGMTINRIKVPEAARGQGEASKALKEVLRQADEQGLTVFLTADPVGAGGMSKAQLEAFYKRNGFVPNKGRNKDFSSQAGMIRPPASPILTAGAGGKRPPKPVPPRTPSKSKLGTRTADAAAIAALSIAPPAQADTGGGANAELEAANERVRIASDRVLQIEKTAIPQLENDLRLIEDPKADPRALQELLARRGLYKGPIDGVIGPQSRDAIAENRKMIRDDLQTQRAELEQARNEETAARQGLKQAEMREIQRKAEPNAALNLAGLVGTTAAIAGGIYLAKKGRAGAVAKSVPAAASATRKANALIAAKAKAPTTAKTGPNSVNERAAKVNQFWKQGGAGKKVPFTVDDKGAWNARPNATEPAELFNPKWYQQYRSGDALAMSVAALDAGGSRLGINKLNEEIEKTEADIKRYEQEGNIAGMERAIKHKTLLEGTRTFAQIMEKLGYGYLAGRAISSPLMPYAKATPNIVNAERERALLLQAMNRPPKAPKTP